jgi:hypothetical protein
VQVDPGFPQIATADQVESNVDPKTGAVRSSAYPLDKHAVEYFNVDRVALNYLPNLDRATFPFPIDGIRMDACGLVHQRKKHRIAGL